MELILPILYKFYTCPKSVNGNTISVLSYVNSIFFDTILKYDVPYIVIIPQRYIIPTDKLIKKAPIRLTKPLSCKFSNISL